jgi:uncharacterized protein YjaZ
MTDEEKIGDESPINRFVHAFSFAEFMEGFDRDVIMVRAVKDRDNWKECLINMLAHELAHQEYYETTGSVPYSNWKNILFEGHAMNRAQQVTQELGIDWSPQYRSDEKLDIDLEKVISKMDGDRTYEPDNIFQNGEKPCENAEGYNLAYQVVKRIIEEENFGLEDVPNLENRKLVEEYVRKVC